MTSDKGQAVSSRDEIQEGSMGSVLSQLAAVACGKRVPHMGRNRATEQELRVCRDQGSSSV